jgi:hypothetical protein
MFKLFKKKTQLEVLQKKYEKLMKEWHRLSRINRAESDKVYAQAEAIVQEMETLKKQ